MDEGSESRIFKCLACGNDRFGAGVIEPSPQGGFDVIMPCKACGAPNQAMHDDDPEMAQMLLSFFAADPSEGETNG